MSVRRWLAMALTLAGCDGGNPPASPDGGATVDGGSAEYRACWYAGGLDRVTITQDDPVASTCARLNLIAPAQAMGLGGITVPMGWSAASASVHDRRCSQSDAGFVSGVDGTGTVGYRNDGGFYPQFVNVHATVRLARDAGSVRFDADDVAVAGSCP